MRKTVISARQITAWEDAPLRHKIFHIFDRDGIEDLDEPHHITWLRWFTLIFMMLFVTMCMLNIIISSLPQFQPNPPAGFQTVNAICVIYFTAEYLLRLFCAPETLNFFLNLLNLQDLLSVIPFYLYLAGVIDVGVSNWILITRSVRLVRGLLYFQNFEIVIAAVGESSEVAALMALIMIVGLPLGGTIMYYAERGTWDAAQNAWFRQCFPPQPCVTQKSPFQNAGDGMWYFIVTTTTLGYGDITPTSAAGKIFGGLIMGVGVMLLAYPIMILAVNFEEERRKEERERTLGKVANGERLRSLQLQQTNALAADDDESRFTRTLPVYFYPAEINQPRELIVISPEEARYQPLFFVQRNRDGSLYLNQALKTSLEVTIRIVFDTTAATKLALSTISHFTSSEADIKVIRARFFPVVRMMFKLDKPQDTACEFLKHLRLVNHVIDDMDLDLVRQPVALELNGFSAQLDDQKKLDFHQALHRCRLHCTALVAYDDPVFFDVPIYLGLLNATALMREMLAKGNGVVYVTMPQIVELLQGLHHLIDLNQSVPTYIINSLEIRNAVARAIILRTSSVCENPKVLKDDAFLYGKYIDNGEQYHGVFVNRLSKKVSSKADDSEYILCNVKVLAVQPTAHHMTFLL